MAHVNPSLHISDVTLPISPPVHISLHRMNHLNNRYDTRMCKHLGPTSDSEKFRDSGKGGGCPWHDHTITQQNPSVRMRRDTGCSRYTNRSSKYTALPYQAHTNTYITSQADSENTNYDAADVRLQAHYKLGNNTLIGSICMMFKKKKKKKLEEHH